MLGCDNFAMPDIEAAIALNLTLGQRTNPAIRCAGVSLNTSAMAESDALALCAAESRRLNLPVADPVRGGQRFAKLVANCLA